MSCTGTSNRLGRLLHCHQASILFQQQARKGTHRLRRLFSSALLLAAFGEDLREVSSGKATSDLRLPVPDPSPQRIQKYLRHIGPRSLPHGYVCGFVVGWCRFYEGR